MKRSINLILLMPTLLLQFQVVLVALHAEPSVMCLIGSKYASLNLKCSLSTFWAAICGDGLALIM